MNEKKTRSSCNQTLNKLPYSALSTIYLLSENEKVSLVSRSMYEASKNVIMIKNHIFGKFGNKSVISKICNSENTFYKHFLKDQEIFISLMVKSLENNYATLFELGIKYKLERVIEGLLGMYIIMFPPQGADRQTYQYFKFNEETIDFDEASKRYFSRHRTVYSSHGVSINMMVENFIQTTDYAFSGIYRERDKKTFKPTYNALGFMYCLLSRLKTKSIQIKLPDETVMEKPYHELASFIVLMLLVVHFSVKRGGLGVMKMYLDDDIKIKVGLARSLGYSVLYVDGAGTLINPSLINRFIGDAADGSSGSVLRSNTGSVDEGVESYGGSSSSTVNTIDNRVNHMLDSSFLEMDLKLSLLLGRLDFNNKVLFDYIAKRGLEKYQAAFLLLRVLKDKNAKVLRWILALNIFDINLINDKIFEICVSMVMYRSKKIINVIKILINSGLDMGKNGYKLLNAATSAKNYEFINYLVGKKSRYDGTSERREKFGLRHNQRWKSSPLKIDQLEDNGLRIASGYFSFNPKMIRHLIDCGAKPTIRNFILLSNVIKKEDYETLEFLLAKAINLKKCPPRFNGLKTAVKHCKDKVKMIMFLVENGADPSACSNTAVRYACRTRDMELVTFLVSKGVSLRQRTGNGVSDLCNNKVWDGRLFRYLVENGANPKSHKGIAMKRVFEENDSESIKFLEQIDMKKAKRAKGGKGGKGTKK